MKHYLLPEGDADRVRSGFSAIDFNPGSKHMDSARITLTDRYPEPGFLARNTVSEMIVVIHEGVVRFWQEGKEEVLLTAGSIVYVEPGKKYYWLPEGPVTIFPTSSPPWTPEQHETVPE